VSVYDCGHGETKTASEASDSTASYKEKLNPSLHAAESVEQQHVKHKNNSNSPLKGPISKRVFLLYTPAFTLKVI